jgi:hypothetical protein
VRDLQVAYKLSGISYRINLGAHLSILATFCKYAEETIDDALQVFSRYTIRHFQSSSTTNISFLNEFTSERLPNQIY